MPLISGILYAQDDDEVAYVLRKLHSAGSEGLPTGLDTEFYNVDVGKQSCAGRAKLHLLSVAWPELPLRLSARGVSVCGSAVLGTRSLVQLKYWLESDAIKAIHNAPVDLHTLANAGIQVKGAVNTLAMARWAWPERARGEGFTLDSLGRDFLGIGKMLSFDEIFSEEVTEYRIRTRKVQACECGASTCRRRSSTPGHARISRVEETQIPKTVIKPIPLESVIYGHLKFPQAVAYSAQDAVLARGLYELASRKMAKTTIEVPWMTS